MPNLFRDQDGLDAHPRAVGGPQSTVVRTTPQVRQGLRKVAELAREAIVEGTEDRPEWADEVAALRWIDLLPGSPQ